MHFFRQSTHISVTSAHRKELTNIVTSSLKPPWLLCSSRTNAGWGGVWARATHNVRPGQNVHFPTACGGISGPIRRRVLLYSRWSRSENLDCLWRRPGQHLSLPAHLSCNPATQLHSASVTRPDRIFEFDIFVVSNFPTSRTATDGPKIITITTIILVITLIRRFVNRKIDSDQNALKCIVCDIVL